MQCSKLLQVTLAYRPPSQSAIRTLFLSVAQCGDAHDSKKLSHKPSDPWRVKQRNRMIPSLGRYRALVAHIRHSIRRRSPKYTRRGRRNGRIVQRHGRNDVGVVPRVDRLTRIILRRVRQGFDVDGADVVLVVDATHDQGLEDLIQAAPVVGSGSGAVHG